MTGSRLTDDEEIQRLMLAGGVLVAVVLLEMLLLSRIVRKVKARPSLPFPDVPWTIGDLMGISLAVLPALVLPLLVMLRMTDVWAQNPGSFFHLFRDVRILRLALGFTLVVQMGLGALVICRGRFGHGMSFSEMGLWIPGWRESLLVPLVAAGLFALVGWQYEMLLEAFHIPGSQLLAQLIPTARSTADRALVYLSGGIVLPMLEELLFRGFLYQVLRRYVGSGWALAVTTFLFAVGHLEPPLEAGDWRTLMAPLLRLPEFLGLGFLLGWLAQRSGSLLPSMVLHMANNLFAICLLRHS